MSTNPSRAMLFVKFDHLRQLGLRLLNRPEIVHRERGAVVSSAGGKVVLRFEDFRRDFKIELIQGIRVRKYGV